MPIPVFNQNKELVFVEVPDILRVYKQQTTRRIIVQAKCGEYTFPSTIEQIIQIMDRSGFCQIDSRSTINLKLVKWFADGKVNVDGVFFKVAKRRRKGLHDALNEREPFS